MANKKTDVQSGFMDFKSLWEAWKAKKKAEEAAKKTLNSDETMIEKLYQSLFGNKNSQQAATQQQSSNFYKPSNTLQPVQQTAAFRPYNQPANGGFDSQFWARNGIQKQAQPPMMSAYNPYYFQSMPGYSSSTYEKKDMMQYYKPQRPVFMGGQAKSFMPQTRASKLQRGSPNQQQYRVAPSPKMHAPVAPNPMDLNTIAKQFYFKGSNSQPSARNYAARPAVSNNNAPAQSRNSMQMELQRLRQLYAGKRGQTTQQSMKSPSHWPAPNSVEEFATNRGIVRIQSVVRPLAKNDKAQLAKNQPQPSKENQLAHSHFSNPWAVYNQLKAQLSSKRDNYKAADSHAASATTSNTWEGATAPDQKGAGHNYGYGYGYGTGDALKGGGWGQGFGGGGPGVNENGNHHTPDFKNPNMQWGQGQGWGQGGKGVQQQTQYKPAPPSGASFYPKREGQSRAPVRHIVQTSLNAKRKNPYFLPKGPSIMNFDQAFIDLRKKQTADRNLFLRGNSPVSSPAYQVKYFMSNDGGTGYPSDSAKSMRNEIISNAVADVLKSIKKKKKKRDEAN